MLLIRVSAVMSKKVLLLPLKRSMGFKRQQDPVLEMEDFLEEECPFFLAGVNIQVVIH